jgi:phage/plasmid-associated DNA primase
MKPMLICDTSELDAHEHKIGCLNGIIDLSSGAHSAPDRAARITKLLNVEYDSNAVCPAFEKLVRDIGSQVQPSITSFRFWLAMPLPANPHS